MVLKILIGVVDNTNYAEGTNCHQHNYSLKTIAGNSISSVTVHQTDSQTPRTTISRAPSHRSPYSPPI